MEVLSMAKPVGASMPVTRGCGWHALSTQAPPPQSCPHLPQLVPDIVRSQHVVPQDTSLEGHDASRQVPELHPSSVIEESRTDKSPLEEPLLEESMVESSASGALFGGESPSCPAPVSPLDPKSLPPSPSPGFGTSGSPTTLAHAATSRADATTQGAVFIIVRNSPRGPPPRPPGPRSARPAAPWPPAHRTHAPPSRRATRRRRA